MAKDVGDKVRDTVTQVVRDATQNLGAGGNSKSNGPLSGMRGVAAGAGLAALAPLAAKGAGKAVKSRLVKGGAKSAAKNPGRALSDATSKLGDSVGKGVGEKVKEKVDESGGVGGIAKQAAGGVLPGLGGGGDGGGGGGVDGVGQGRRMPVQQAVDVAVPIETAYNQWTQFEAWPEFMHRVTRVTQEDDDCTVSFATKIWTRTREFKAEIITQRPDERIKWRVSQGITHTGVVTFHELAPRLTRVEVNMDVDPGSLIEKAARGMRHVKRAVRADLHRFKAYIEMQEQETGAWRGVIEDGELVEDHDPSYDEEREYSDGAAAASGDESESHEGEEEREDEEPDAAAEEEQAEEESDEDRETQRQRVRRFERQARASSSGRSRSRGSNSGGGGRSSGGRSGGQRRKSSRS
jgi:uncharacterized membrane protein